MVQNKRGQIFFISSKAGVTPSAGLAVHSGTKHMVEALAKSLRLELQGSGVGVGVIRPGGINTPGNDLTLVCPTSDSASSSKFHHLALLALFVALVFHSSNFHHWPLLALLVALVLH